MYRCGLDLGGTKIEGVVLDEAGTIRFRQRIPTHREQGYEFILNQIAILYGQMQRHMAQQEHTLGIGTPGAISRKTGLLKNSCTLCLNDKPLQQDLEQLLNHRLVLQNDANCFALAEAQQGAAIAHDIVFGVIMGTGCGGGIVIHGDVLLGRQAIAGEWGHSSIDPQGPMCWCGARGCVETLISGFGVETLYQQQAGTHLPLPEIVEQYRRGTEPARAIMQQFFENFGRAIANVINLLDPDVVVLGGGLSNMDELYSVGVRSVARQVFSDEFNTPIVKNRLGDSAGVIGAALIGVR